MRKYIREIIILFVQIFLFYILPLFAGPTDIMGLIILLVFGTFVLGLVIGVVSKLKLKYIYPIIVVLLFVPTVFIYYNETAFVHSLWYLVSSTIGEVIGILVNLFLTNKKEDL